MMNILFSQWDQRRLSSLFGTSVEVNAKFPDDLLTIILSICLDFAL